MDAKRFSDLPLRDTTLAALEALDYKTPTTIQRLAIPHLLAGDDLLAQARTGTGKTAAFGIPIVERLHAEATGVRALVLVPTRELADQVAGVLGQIADGTEIRIATVYGGVAAGPQIRAMNEEAPIVCVACPGRLLDLYGRGRIDLGRLQVLVLDEADRMLDMGFRDDIDRIAKALPAERQTALFSATLPRAVQRIAQAIADPEASLVTAEEDAAPALPSTIDTFQLRVEEKRKVDTLLHLLAQERPRRAVAFVRMKHIADRLTARLNNMRWSAVAMQGDMSQPDRERALRAFRNGKARILVATDVAARGLDVDGITHVFNMDLPQEPEAYIHRVGRTGRKGRRGKAFTFVESHQVAEWQVIHQLAGGGAMRQRHDFEGAPAKGPDEPFVISKPARQGRPAAGTLPRRGAKPGGPRKSRGRGSTRHPNQPKKKR